MVVGVALLEEEDSEPSCFNFFPVWAFIWRLSLALSSILRFEEDEEEEDEAAAAATGRRGASRSGS